MVIAITIKLLSKAVETTNSSKEGKSTKNEDGIFEPVKQAENKSKTNYFSSYRPILLPLKDLFRNRKIKFDIPFEQLQTYFERTEIFFNL